jgi:flagellar biosynthesis protein FlhA
LTIRLAPEVLENINRTIFREAESLTALGRPPIALVSPPIRPAVKRLTAAQVPQLIVLSYGEITRDTKIESVATISET